MGPRLAALIGAIGVSGCASQLFYSGDGHLKDHGVFSSIDRYVVELGPIDLRRLSDQTYQIGYLPRVRFTVGIDVVFDSERASLSKPIDPLVAIELASENGEVVLSQQRRLSEWSWAEWVTSPQTPFVWLDGVAFEPRFGERYRLRVRLLEPDGGTLAYRASLALKGGGWKS
jgi:hypothetical protein